MLRRLLAPDGLTALAAAPAQNTPAFVVTRATADRYHLAKLSDLAAVDDRLRLGGPPECPQWRACLPGLQRAYGLRFER